MSDNLEPRIVALEVSTTYNKEVLDDTRKTLYLVVDKVDDIQSRLDKQNGAIPHLVESVHALSVDFKSFKEIYTANELAKVKEDIGQAAIVAEGQTKLKLIWGLGAAVLTALISGIISLLLS